jgi:hypothetical protein
VSLYCGGTADMRQADCGLDTDGCFRDFLADIDSSEKKGQKA